MKVIGKYWFSPGGGQRNPYGMIVVEQDEKGKDIPFGKRIILGGSTAGMSENFDIKYIQMFGSTIDPSILRDILASLEPKPKTKVVKK